MNLQVGVKAFLKNPQGKYLLLKRNTDKYQNIKGLWDIVGGRIESEGTLLENLAREVNEETKLPITSEPELIHAQDIFHGENNHVVRLTYVANTEGAPTLDTTENVDFKWLTFNELKNQNNLDIYTKEVIEKRLIT